MDDCLACLRFLLLTVALLFVGPPGLAAASDGLPPGFPPPSSPERTLQGIKLADPSLEVTLYAAEPLVRDPVCIAWDEEGRLFVVEMADYPNGPPAGRIKLLRDTDGDGLPDRSTTFAEIPFPTGVFPWQGGIFVTAAPHIWYLKDTDGDDKADQKTIVFTGFAEGNQQHRVNGLIWGLDGWIWGANGDSGGVITRPGENWRVNIRGRDFRFDPLSYRFEAVPGQCQYGDTFDAFGNRYICNNSDHIRFVVFDAATLGLNPYVDIPFAVRSIARHGGKGRLYPISPVLPRFNMPLDAGRFSGACGLFVLRGGLLPERYWGNAFVCDCVLNVVHRDVLQWEDGLPVAIRAPEEQKREFFAASDPWVRPVYVTVGPDGALYVCDMYRAVIEHPEWIPDSIEQKLDLQAGADRGRIYRIAPRGSRPESVRIRSDDVAQLASLITARSPWQQDTAYRLLVERADVWPQAIRVLRRAFDRTDDAVVRLRLAAVLVRLGDVPAEELVQLLGAAEPRVRAATLRLVRTIPPERLGRPVIESVAAAIRDKDSEVQREAAATAGVLGDRVAERPALLAGLLSRSGEQIAVRTAALLAARDCEAEVLAQLVQAGSDSAPWIPETIEQLARAAGRRGHTEKLLRVAQQLPSSRRRWKLSLLSGWARAKPHSLDGSEALRRELVMLVEDPKVPAAERVLAARALRLWKPWAELGSLVQAMLGPGLP